MYKPFKIFSRFIIFNLILFLLTGPFIVLYGPFDNTKNAVIGAIATSRHRYWLSYFLNDEKIKSVLASRHEVVDKLANLADFKNNHSNEIKFSTITGARFKGYLLEISDPTRIKVGVSKELGVTGQTTSQIAKQNNAIAAVNAGGFDDPKGTGTGRLPIGIIVHDGYYLAGDHYKGALDVVGLDEKGALIAGKYKVSELKEMKVKEAITFGPVLIVNGEKQITQGDGGWGIGPRTAIGQKEDGTILLLVIDGRQPGHSIGATLLDIQNILYENGAYLAANLDGGSSATMYYKDKVVNKPCDILGERSIPTAFIVK